MAIGPKPLEERIHETDADDISRLEQLLDRMLEQHYDGQPTTTITLDRVPRLRVRNILIDKYRKAGWGQVTFGEDQRDGAWVTFHRGSDDPTDPFRV